MKISFVIVMLMVLASVQAQKLSSKLGKVSQQDLEMTVYEPDTSAVAVVLYQSGYFSGVTLKYSFTRRVKVLKKEGVNYAEYAFRSDENTSVSGRTYNLVDGKVVQERLKSESIFKEKYYDDVYYYKIAMPNVKVGSVFEIEYTQDLLPAEFKFQDFIPVVLSELIIESHPNIEYRNKQVGYWSVKNHGNGMHSATNVPAFKRESYTNSYENYISKMEFDILRITAPGYFKAFTTSWESVNERLRASTYFGGTITNGAAYLNDLKKEIESRYSTPKDRCKAAYEAIKTIKWNNESRLFASVNNLSTQFKKQSGNSAELNMMLYQLLQKLDISSYPLVMSTRENGMLNPFYPSLIKLDYTLVVAKIDDKDVVMDATEQYMPFGMLPLHCLNGQARLVNNEDGRWVDLTPSQKDRQSVMYRLRFTPEHDLEATLDLNLVDYAAVDFRKQFHNFASEEKFIESFENDHSGFLVKDYQFVNIDSLDQPCRFNVKGIIKGKSQKVNDLLLVYPMLYDQVKDNPFKVEERKYPVDYGYKREWMVSSVIEIPEGYQVESLPEPAKLRTEDNGLSVMISCSQTGNMVSATYRFSINKIMFLSEEYPMLREVYSQIIQKHAQPVVFKKISHVAEL